MWRTVYVVAVVLIFLFVADQASVAFANGDIIFSFSGGAQTSGQNVTYGFRFRPLVDILVDSLGYYDFGSDGLDGDHQVGIWDWNTIGPPPIATATVTTANSILAGPVINGGQYRFTPITPVKLSAQKLYVFGAQEQSTTDIWYGSVTIISNSPSLVSVIDGRFGFNYTNTLIMPTQNYDSTYLDFSYTYANGNFTAYAVPEPSTLALLALGAVGLLATRKHMNKSCAAIASFLVVALLLSVAQSRALGEIVFDSFNGTNNGGGTTAGNGFFMQVTALQNVTINNISILTETDAGIINFEIYSASTRALLLETAGIPFSSETKLTWKTSPDFTFTLISGNSYVIGSTDSAARIEASDSENETQNGIRSDLIGWVHDAGSNETVRPFDIGVEPAVRLIAIPEPSTLALLSLGGLIAFAAKRRRG